MSYENEIKDCFGKSGIMRSLVNDNAISFKKEGRNIVISIDTSKQHKAHIHADTPQSVYNMIKFLQDLGINDKGVETIDKFLKYETKGRQTTAITVTDPKEIETGQAIRDWLPDKVYAKPAIVLTIPDNEHSLKTIVEANKIICKSIASNVLRDAIKCIKGNLDPLGENLSKIAFAEVLKEHGLAIGDGKNLGSDPRKTAVR